MIQSAFSFSEENVESKIDILHKRTSVFAASNQSLLWGTYRPNLYFGTRPRLPESLLTGLMWFGFEDISSIKRKKYIFLFHI